MSGLDNPYFLPEQEARRIFDQDIVPEQFAGLASHRDAGLQPLAVIVVGQPGAGKSGTTSFIQDVLATRRGDVAHVVGDFYKPYHPAYAGLLVSDPQKASPATSPDARRWITMAVDHVISQRMDVLMESAGRDRADFADLAQRFHDAGYRVEVAVLAVHESLSRQGILARYHEGPEQGRLTARATHDQSYAGVLDSAEFIDTSDAVDAVTVLRRGNTVVYSNVRRDGAWQDPAGCRQAVEDERATPFTEQVAEAFTATNERLTAEMGQDWRAELQEVRALAAPLLPGTEASAAEKAQRVARQGFPTRPSTGRTGRGVDQAPRTGEGPGAHRDPGDRGR